MAEYGRSKLRQAKSLMPAAKKQPLSFSHGGTVPQTDTGGRGEYPQALGLTIEKELGKITP